MLKYMLKRFLWLIPTLLGVMIFLFSLTYLLPGNPADIILGNRATPEMRETLNQKLGLDKPWPISLLKYITQMLRGDLGRSIFRDTPVLELINNVLPYTFILTFSSMGIAVLIGVVFGMLAASFEKTAIDKIITVFSLASASIPDFVYACLLVLFFSVRLDLLPVMGGGEPGNINDILLHLIGPALALSLNWAGYIIRLVRSSMLETLNADFITTAKSFGLPMRVIVYKYALKRAIKPIVAVVGLGIGRLLGGAVFVEVIFTRPGLGRLLVDAIYKRNLPVVRGGVLIAALLFVFANILADISYAYFDPRIRYD
jgi:peptide/nickel transport system permease protein